MKSCVIDVGGGMRGVYAAGVLDKCLEEGISFDVGIGVSAGSANISTFMAGQKKRNYKYYTEYSQRKEYMGIGNLIKNGGYLNLDYAYGVLPVKDGENPFDFESFNKNTTRFISVATDALTGEAVYFEKDKMRQDNYDILKASAAIPVICTTCKIDGRQYFDGALSDPVPIQKAFELGCDKVVLILTKPKDTLRVPGKDKVLASMIKRKFPIASKKLSGRADKYNEEINKAKEYEKEGKVLILSPEDTCGMDTLTRDLESMDKMYNLGMRDAEKIKTFLAK